MNYRYGINEGVTRVKTNAKKYFVGVMASVAMVSGAVVPTMAAPSVSSNANPAACFGQARAYYAKGGPNGVLAPNSNGTYISERKGTNPENNADYRAANCNQ